MRILLIGAMLLAINYGFCQVTPPKLSGIWIPVKVNWKSGDFNTYYFGSDSSVVIISSVQKKIKDSIYFNTEEGYNIFAGTTKPESSKVTIASTKVVYRFMKISGFDYNKVFKDTIVRIYNNGSTLLRINGVLFHPARLYKAASKEEVIGIATKTVPMMKKDPAKYQ